MSESPTKPTALCSSSNFQTVFNTALKEYEKRTKKDLLAHPLAAQLQSCYSITAILTILEDQVQQFDQHRRADERLTKWLNPTVNVLYAFSATLGEGVGIVNFW
jgi:2C-methyl-D-erythritol 2,4-cyclodiphosphate synthase